MTGSLPAEAVRRFRRDGYLGALDVLEPREARTLRERVERFERARPDADWALDIKTNLLFDWVYGVCAHPRLLDIVESLLGPDIACTNAVFRLKSPGSSTAYGWHQDGARIQTDPPFLIAYVAITSATRENGCLHVIPGSHDRVRPFELVVNDDGQARRRVARTRDVEPDQAVPLVLEPGQVAIFDANTVHGSAPNRGTDRRMALLIDYTAAHARQSIGKGSGQILRGVDRFGHIAHEPVPSGECRDDDVRMRREFLSTYPENPLMGPLAPDERARFPDRPEPAHARGRASSHPTD